LKLFWFSQTVGGDRGLEIIIAAMSLISKPAELHLLGSCLPADKQHILKSAKDNGIHENQIYFHRPIAAGDIIKLAARFDIGMATETASSLNRDICLTNKIFTYVQAGLAVIASDTQAQELFLEQYPDSGNLYHKNEVQSMANCINQYAENPESLYRIRELNYGLGQTTLNWETESKIFRNIVEQTLNNVQ
jgi:glycosyltransferase involved in cell wall biosynthesis